MDNLCDQIRAIGNELAINAIYRPQRAFDLRRRIIPSLQSSDRGFNYRTQAGNIPFRSFSDLNIHFVMFLDEAARRNVTVSGLLRA